jgi:D-lactate dehydrogenase
MKIACFELEQWEENYLRDKLGSGTNLKVFDHPVDEKSLDEVKDVEILVIFIYSSITKEVLDKLSNLKFIATMSTGFDHIDIEECKTRNISVSNVAGYGEISVAEHTFALLLSISRRIIESYERVKEGYFSPENLTGFDLEGKTLGVIGVGSIGKHVIKIANGFGINVIGYKRNPDPELEKELGFKIVDLDYLYKSSDIITLHVPYSKETHHMINADAFEKMKEGVVVLNTSRGPLIDTSALLKYLGSGKLGGAGLDVCENEPLLREEKEILSKEFNKEDLLCLIEEKMLLNFKNVVITPHNAFNSKEALEKIILTTTENIKGFLNNSLQNIVSVTS